MSSGEQSGFDTEFDNEFERGRAEGFKKIRALMAYNTRKSAVSHVDDYVGTGVGLNHAQSNIARFIEKSMNVVLEQCRLAVENLEAGETVYALTGLGKIKSYEAITDGDYKAGIHSAAKDFEIMLMSLDSAKVIAPILPTAAENQWAGDDLKRTVELCAFGVDCMIEDFFTRTREKIVHKTGVPKRIAYEGESLHKNKAFVLKSIGKKFREAAHPVMRGADKIPNSWPPFKSGTMQQESKIETVKKKPHERKVSVIQEPDLPVNENDDFKAGYKKTLEALHQGIQDIHFQALNEDGNYWQLLKLSAGWRKDVDTAATVFFGHFRDSIQNHLAEEARKGIGDNTAEGESAAIGWCIRELTRLSAYKGRQVDVKEQTLDDALKIFWAEQAEGFCSFKALTKRSNPNRKPKPPGMSPE